MKLTYECTGYHGTDIGSCEKIILTNKFIDSVDDEEWLGSGVYFFENDKKQAIYYMSKAKKKSEYKVISCDIKSDNLLDLLDISNYENFERFAVQLKDRYKKRKDGKQRVLMNGVILNFMHKVNPYDVVRGVFDVPRRTVAPRTNIKPVQIQICVKNHDCISNIKEESYEELL